MKAIKFLLGAFAAASMLIGCQKPAEDLGTPKLELSESAINFESTEEASQTITVTATRDWAVQDYDKLPEWLSINPNNGKGAKDAQTITVSVTANDGQNRSAEVTFTIGTISKKISVSQTGAAGDPADAIVYFNNFDKTEATQGSDNGWPYPSEFDGFKNETGTGAANVTYNSYNVTVRANSNSNGDHSVCKTLSGVNNIFLGKATPYFEIQKIALGSSENYKLSFGASKYVQGADNKITPEILQVWISNDGAKYVQLKNYTFASGSAPDGKWDLISTSFTLPKGTAQLYIYFTSSEPSACRFDDVKLEVSATAGTAIDFTKGTKPDGGNAGGGETGGDAKEYALDAVAGLANGTAVIVKGHIVATYGQGFLISDGTNYLLIYEKKEPANAVGSKVTVTGAKSEYGGQAQIGDIVSVAANGTQTVTHPTPKLITKDNAEELKSISKPTYVQYTGSLTISSGKYYNITIDGATLQGSPQYPIGSIKETLTANEGKAVTVTGYFVGISSSKYISTMATKVEAAEGGNQGGGNEGGNQGGGETPSADAYKNTLSYTAGNKTYEDKATINGISDCPVIKLGTSSVNGDFTVTIPAGTKSVSFYAVAWKGKTAKLVVDGMNISQDIKANNGATGNSPYTLTITDADHYTLTLPAVPASDTNVKIIAEGRAIIFGMKANK